MPIITPQNPQGSLPNTQATPGAESPRQRAINAFKEAAAIQSPQSVVQNQTHIAAEEMSAIQAPSKGLPDNIEVAPESAPPEATKSQEAPLSTQYAILARKEKALRAKAQAQDQSIRQREAQILAREEAIKLNQESQRAEYESKYIQRDRIAKDPLNVLAELGLSSDQITQLALNAPSQQEMAQRTENENLKAELRAIRDELNGVKKGTEERDTQSYQQALKQIRMETKQLVQSDPYFESIKQTGQIGEVVSLIEKVFKEDGIVMDVEQAAKLVEDELTDRLYKTSNRINKVRNRLNAAKAADQSASKASIAPGSQKPQSKTLTNAQTSARTLTARERAMLAFDNKLKG